MRTVAHTISAQLDEILRLWTTEIRRTTSARLLSARECLDVIPSYVRALGDGSSDESDAACARRRDLVDAHLASRLRQGFDLNEIVDEFGALGRCMARVWADLPADERPDPVDVERVLTALSKEARYCANAFQRHMRDDEQREKRYSRLLDSAAAAALRSLQGSRFATFAPVLDVVRDATDACAAALVIRDDATGEQTSPASVGIDGAGDALRRFAMTIDLPPTELDPERPVISAEIPADGSLCSSGIRVVLTTLLATRHGAPTALLLGGQSPGAFAPRKIRCLELLAERLALHIDSARLYEDLRTTIAQLRAEQLVRERFVSVLAHDLRGPLSVAQGAAHLLGSLEPTEPYRTIAGRIDRALGRADRMVRDLLDANRLRAGEKLPLQVGPCDLANITAEVVDEAAALHGERFVLETSRELHGHWSANELRRALWNLLVNAVKYGAEGRPITTRVERRGDDVVISVHNAGPPIPRQHHATLFDPFVRTPSAEDGLSLGWGLGLTLVRGCAEAHGGSVHVESDASRGTTFTMLLPMDARPFQRAHAAPAAAVPMKSGTEDARP